MRPGRLNVIDAAPLAPRREIEGGRYISRGTLLFNLARLLGCLHTARGETRVCPVCDSKIEWDAKRCSSCQTDLSLFDIDADEDLSAYESFLAGRLQDYEYAGNGVARALEPVGVM